MAQIGSNNKGFESQHSHNDVAEGIVGSSNIILKDGEDPITATRELLRAKAAADIKQGLFFGLSEDEAREHQITHIIRAHLGPSHIIKYGVPIFDLELYIAMNWNLDPICDHIYHLLSRRQVGNYKESYVKLLIKTLRFIDLKKPGQIKWSIVAQHYANYETVHYDPNRDTLDSSFDENCAAIKATLK